jgi:hypothetical protein
MDQLLRTFEFFEGGLIKERTSHQLWLITIYPMMKITLCQILYSALIKADYYMTK